MFQRCGFSGEFYSLSNCIYSILCFYFAFLFIGNSFNLLLSMYNNDAMTLKRPVTTLITISRQHLTNL